jgi:hypothetical protein
MRSNFLIPIIVWLPRGYELTIVSSRERVEKSMPGWSGQIERYAQVVCAGKVLEESALTADVVDGKIVSDWPDSYSYAAGKNPDWPADGGFLEFGIRSVDDSPAFSTKQLPGAYNLYTGDGVKSFIMCQTWKFGSPQVITQIAALGRYVDAYSVIHIDFDKDLGDSLVLINPYLKPIVAEIVALGHQKLPRIRIAPLTVKRIDLATLVPEGARAWQGAIQLSANNRLVTQIVKHSAKNPDTLTTVEHLDPFRGDPTHMPAFQTLRNVVGDWLKAKRG